MVIFQWFYLCFAVLLSIGACSAGSCRISRDLKIADCSYSLLRHIPSRQLRKYRHTLETLRLQSNKISVLQNNAFLSLSKLKHINLNDNIISAIEESAFEGLRSLRTLSLGQHNLSMTKHSFPDSLFRFTTNLIDLDLSTSVIISPDFKIRTIYPHRSLGMLNNLRRLHLPLYPNPLFGSGFRNLTKLRTLMFRGCVGSILKNETFFYFRGSRITELSITNCGYNDENVLEKNTFHAFPHLMSLNLSGSGFTFPKVMESLYGLRNKSMNTLNLYNVNPFSMLWSYRMSVTYSVRVTQHMTRYFKYMCVKNINIGKNGITEMQVGTLFRFDNASCIRNYIVSENNFIPPFPKFFGDAMHFDRSTNLEAFSMSHMLLQYRTHENNGLSSGRQEQRHLTRKWDTRCPTEEVIPIPCPRNLKYVDISYIIAPFTIQCKMNFTGCQQLEKFDFSYSTILDVGFELYGIENTKHVILSGLDVSVNGHQLLRNFKHSEHLVLRDANLDEAFKNRNYVTTELIKTRHLDLAFNHLTLLPNNSLQEMTNLTSINLRGNSLSKFPTFLLSNKNLRIIDVRENKLEGLSQDVLDVLDNNPEQFNNKLTILLHGNSFRCTCEYKEFIKWLYTTRIKLDDKNKSYTCTLGNNTTKLPTLDVYRRWEVYFEHCESRFWLIVSMSGVALLSLCILGLSILYRFRWRVIYFCLRRCRSHYQMVDTNEYSFDAFIAYSGDDYKWIWNDVRSFMEKEKQLKLCLHEREFTIGESISQNIVDFMRDSRKIVFDITPGYLEAKWCEFELEMAHIESVQRRDDAAIIVIIRKDVNPSDMPKVLKDIWHRVTCLPFSEDNEERDFWQSFYDAITA